MRWPVANFSHTTVALNRGIFLVNSKYPPSWFIASSLFAVNKFESGSLRSSVAESIASFTALWPCLGRISYLTLLSRLCAFISGQLSEIYYNSSITCKAIESLLQDSVQVQSIQIEWIFIYFKTISFLRNSVQVHSIWMKSNMQL